MISAVQRVGLAILVLLAAPAVRAQGGILSADGTPVELAGRLSNPNGEGPAILHLDAPVTVVAHVANVIEPITSLERAFQVRAPSREIESLVAQAARAGDAVTIAGRLWWAGSAETLPSYVIDAVTVTPRR